MQQPGPVRTSDATARTFDATARTFDATVRTSDATARTSDATARTFDATTHNFDRLGEFLWRPVGAATLERTAPRPGERVLDACCGTGATAIPTALRVGRRGYVDAVDLSSTLVGELSATTAVLPHLHAHCADVTAWDDDGYDLVQCVLGIFFFPDMAAGTEHLVRRARPGGRLGLTIWRRGAMETAGRHLQDAVAQVTGVPAEPRPESVVDQLGTRGTYAAWLSDRGLEDVEVTVDERQLRLTPRIAWLLVAGSGYVAALDGLDATQVEQVRRTYLTSLQQDGVTDLDISTLIGTGRRSANRSSHSRLAVG